EGDLVGVLAGDGAKDADGRGHGVAAALQGELADVLGVEVRGVGGEAGPGGVLHTLVHGEDGDVAGAGEAARIKDRLEVPQDGDGAVGLANDPVHEVGAGEVEHAAGNGAGLVAEESVGVLPEQRADVGGGGGHG